MAKEYSITLHEPPTTQLIREGMEQHLNQVAQEGWKMVTVVKENRLFLFLLGKRLMERCDASRRR